MTYGPNIGSVYHAAKQLLALAPVPVPTPPPPVPPPQGCNLTGSWRFFDAKANASETNGFKEDATGNLQLSPGHNDPWKSAHGTFQGWTAQITYNTGPKPVAVACAVNRTCDFIRCPAYTYSRISHQRMEQEGGGGPQPRRFS